jgi:D-alanyl-D-alanine carboxypeptidase (penicillin-binding protein 5/6)
MRHSGWAGAILGAFAALAGWAGAAVPAGAIETRAEYALLIDHETGSVLLEKNADQPFPPASLVKLMTVEVVFHALKTGKLNLDQEFPVSEFAWRTGGAPSRTSSMYAPIKSNVKVSDLIQGIIVQSANDGALVIAEGMAGTEGAFVRRMNERAAELGLTRSQFGNPTGLPHPDQRMSARDLAKLSGHIIRTYPEQFRIYAQREFTYNNIRQQNRNPLLDDGIGADGMKTGFIRESGFNLVGTAVQGGQRLILVLGGLKSERERAEDGRKLLDWGFKTFELITLFDQAQPVIDAKVLGGAAATVAAVTHAPIKVFAERGARDKLRAEVVMRSPLVAPIAKDQPIGEVKVYRDQLVVGQAPVFAAGSVEQGPLWARAWAAASARIAGSLGLMK